MTEEQIKKDDKVEKKDFKTKKKALSGGSDSYSLASVAHFDDSVKKMFNVGGSSKSKHHK
jgi:hypothetical protein